MLPVIGDIVGIATHYNLVRTVFMWIAMAIPSAQFVDMSDEYSQYTDAIMTIINGERGDSLVKTN